MGGNPKPLLANMRQRDGLVPFSVVTGSLAGMTDAEAVNALWDALRIEACSTGTKAHRIVMLHKHDLENAMRRIKPENK